MASRRRRRKGIGKVITSVERKVRRIEKRPGAKRLKSNVVSTEKLVQRAVVTKNIAKDAVTGEEAAFGIPVISPTEPTENLKEGTLWVDPTDGAASIYDFGSSSFIPVTDATAQTIASSKNTTYVQNDAPTGGTYTVGDLWIDINDGNKLYAWNGTSWVARQDGAIATAQATADGKNTIYRQTTTPTGGTYVSGDIWFDVDDNNRIYRYSSTTSTSTVTNKALTNNVATLTTSAAHFFTPGETITVSGVDATFNGSYTVIAVPTSTTLTYAKTATNVTSTASGGSITNAIGWKAAVLGGSALANINANSITTGTIDASVITVSNINAGNIATGTLDASIITVRNAVGADRIELNNLGLFAYQSNVATVSITNTGTAVFSGTVNANGGAFSGYVTGGTMRFGANVDGTNDGIYINANNYWYDNGDFRVGSSTNGIVYDATAGTVTIGSTASIGGTAASTVVSGASSGATALQPNGTLTGTVSSTALIGSTTASTVVSGAAEGATALQEGNGVTKNASDQIVTIGTSTGIRIGTAPTATGNTARVEINSSGFFAYNGSEATVSITSAGNATFKGTVNASTFSSTNGTTGGIYIGPYGAGIDAVSFYSGGSFSGDLRGSATGFSMSGSAGQSIIMTNTGGISLNNASGLQTLLLSNAQSAVMNLDMSTLASLRNIEITTTATAHNDSAAGYRVGEVRLVRQV